MSVPFRRSLAVVFSAAILSFAPLAGAAPAKEAPLPPDLPARFATWLEDVALLIGPKEREAFLALGKDYQRDAFIRRFWQVRDPFPQTPRNELQERWEKRVEVARERFGNLTDDRARMVLYNGEPAHVLQARCEVLLPLEIWDYPGTERIRGDFSLVFIARGGSGPGSYQLWYPGDGVEWLLSQSLRVQSPDPSRSLQAIADLCPRGEDIAARLGEALDWKRVESTLQLVPRPGEEWLSTFAAYSTEVPEGAPSFPAQVDLSFPGRFGSRTVVQALVAVPRHAVQPERLEGSAIAHYSFLVDGEVLYKGDLFEHFRYRFTLPETEVTSDSIPIVFQRYLRPGSYSLAMKIEDTAGKRFFREQRELEVPTVETAPAAATPAADPAATAAAPALAEANAAIAASGGSGGNGGNGSDEQSIRILPPPPGLITGKVRVETAATGAGVAKVSFELDGRPVLAKSRPPYSVELNLGDQPRAHTVRAVALGEDGRKLAEDEIQLNVGPHRFAVRLVEPQTGRTYQTSLSAQAQVEVPEGERLDRVEFFLNDDRVATLYQPPFSQPILLPKGREITFVRAVAYLDGGTSTEDLVLINAPEYVGQVDVQFVEVYTSVVDGKGRPVEGLAKDDFTVVEDGVPQQVRRFERVRGRADLCRPPARHLGLDGGGREARPGACAAPCASSRRSSPPRTARR